VHVVTPDDVAGVVNPDESWIVTVADGIVFSFFVNPVYRVGPDFPLEAVLALAEKQRRPPFFWSARKTPTNSPLCGRTALL